MKKIKFLIVLFSLFWRPEICEAQLDTLVIYDGQSPNYFTVKKSLRSENLHKLIINLDDFPPYESLIVQDKKNTNLLEDVSNLLDKKLCEVKVLFVIHPTTSYIQDTSQSIKYDTTYCSIYKLNFKKMTSLQEVVLIGNDMDDIIQMPIEFYKTPTKTILYTNLFFPDRLRKDILKNGRELNFIQISDGDVKMYMKVLMQ